MLTKKDYDQLETKFKKIFLTKEEFFAFKDQILTSLDAVMGELKAMREELIVTNYRQRENTDRIDVHEERLRILEEVKKAKALKS
jgi:hypothetical protein